MTSPFEKMTSRRAFTLAFFLFSSALANQPATLLQFGMALQKTTLEVFVTTNLFKRIQRRSAAKALREERHQLR
jgi:hypothetical protein